MGREGGWEGGRGEIHGVRLKGEWEVIKSSCPLPHTHHKTAVQSRILSLTLSRLQSTKGCAVASPHP